MLNFKPYRCFYNNGSQVEYEYEGYYVSKYGTPYEGLQLFGEQ